MAHAKIKLTTGAIIIIAAAASAAYLERGRLIPLGGMAFNYVRAMSLPAGTITTEHAPVVAPAASAPQALPRQATADWPSYNQTLTGDRFSPLDQINRSNVGGLKILCSYDTKQYTSFETGPIMVAGSLIATTEYDIFSLNPATCAQNWRTHDSHHSNTLLAVNRGAAYLEGRLFRGTEDGRVIGYDFATGSKLWETRIADDAIGESVPSAPIAWKGLVFIGVAGGDNKGVKGRMYALDAKTGKIAWEFYLVPKEAGDPQRGPQGASPLGMASWHNNSSTPVTGGGTWTSFTLDPATGLLYVPGGNPGPDFASEPRPGENLYSGALVVLDAMTGAYKTHYEIQPADFHDWDVSTAPALIQTWAGKSIVAEAPKDGNLYAFDVASGKQVFRSPVNHIENITETFAVNKPVHFCPGSVGGDEWSSAAYDKQTNLILTGGVEWCVTVTLKDAADIKSRAIGKLWTANAAWDPYHAFGKFDSISKWAGWLYATDADSGAWRWRAKTNYPILGGTTPTAGGLVLFGDIGGNFYALDAANGDRLWGEKVGGGIGGGVITYTDADGAQKIAVAAGFTAILWPTPVTTAKIFVLGLK